MSLDDNRNMGEGKGMNAVPKPTSESPEEIDYSGYVIEDDTPVDNIESEKQQRLLTEPLYSSGYAPPPREDGSPRSFVAFANVGLFAIGERTAIVPDAMVSLDIQVAKELWLKKNRSYFVSVFGKLPEVVIEVVSNDEGEELGTKRGRYSRMKIPHYVVWDPDKILSDTSLHCFELRGDLLVPVESSFFPDLGLRLQPWRGEYEGYEYEWLRWCTADGVVVPTGAELAAKEKALADAAQTRADAAQTRADAEQRRAERLAEKLRALGVSLD